MKLYRICFIAILLNGSSAQAWETNPPPHNAYRLKPLLMSTDPGVKSAAKDLKNCDQRIVRNIAPLLSQPRGDLQTAGLDLAQIASTRSIDPSTTHAVLSLSTLLQEENSPHLEKVQALIEKLKSTEQSAENCAIGREADELYRATNRATK